MSEFQGCSRMSAIVLTSSVITYIFNSFHSHAYMHARAHMTKAHTHIHTNTWQAGGHHPGCVHGSSASGAHGVRHPTFGVSMPEVCQAARHSIGLNAC
eukprot:436382-Pelagomonas_calceolata.AAC.2